MRSLLREQFQSKQNSIFWAGAVHFKDEESQTAKIEEQEEVVVWQEGGARFSPSIPYFECRYYRPYELLVQSSKECLLEIVQYESTKP